jgi:hypothetical protein
MSQCGYSCSELNKCCADKYTAALKMALDELKKLEWCSDENKTGLSFCPVCHYGKNYGHSGYCTLAATIRRLEELGGESE